jgi:ABC-type glycerol-3-phosphate transport system permease component
MFKIILPMVLPTCATLFVLDFITQWNAYESFLIWYPSTPNIAYGMYTFQNNASQGSGAATVPEILAGFIMCMIPSSILYLSTQKLIQSKFTVGGLKG